MRIHPSTPSIVSTSFIAFLAACGTPAAVPVMTPDPAMVPNEVTVRPPAGKSLVDSIVSELSTREMVAQLIFPWLLGDYASLDQAAFLRATEWVEEDNVGGILISIGSPLDVAAKLNELQRRSNLPLLVAADLEWGSAMRLVGGTAFPYPMALGATGSESDAYEMARVTALEARAVGIHMTFSPVADLNNNPDNPIINTRSFGENPDDVSRLISAYIRGAEEHGLYTTAKHFPGHGDTGTDSHIDLPVSMACWDRLDSLELVPFRGAIAAGVTAVMTAHIALPCFHRNDEQLPATMSPRFMTDILRDSLGFDGLVVTDALVMGAIVSRYGAGEAVVRAFLAGSDLLLMPTDVPEAIDAMVAAVRSGRITSERLQGSVRRVLELKVRAGLFEGRTVSLEDLPRTVGTAEFQQVADGVAARSVTLVSEGAMREFRETSGNWALILYAEETNLSVGNTLLGELRAAGNTVSRFRLYPSSGPLSYDSARTVIARSDRVLFASSVRPIAWRGHIALPDSLAGLITSTSHARPTLLASLGSPYLLDQVTDFTGAFLIAWSAVGASERAVAHAVTGANPINGHSPIAISAEVPHGFGIQLDVPANRRPPPRAAPGERGFDETALGRAVEYLRGEVDAGSFPGAVLAVGRSGSIVLNAAVGSYGTEDRRPVSDSTIYDLASLTKVVALTTAAAMLVNDGRLDLDAPVSRYIPEYTSGDKSRVLVRHLLTHTSGLPAWRPLYQETEDSGAARALALATPLDTSPGRRYVYSDIGAITLATVIERITGQPLDEFVGENIFEPLGMRDTGYLPSAGQRSRIAPTEMDPWRDRVLRGEVHDENAHRLGGVSGHAGLFSTVHDLSRFALRLLDIYHDRIDDPRLSGPVLREFVRRQELIAGSTRALGWDTPSDTLSSAGSLMSPTSFGHTGFTGTSIWIDPERDMFIILLTNRVHPTRENNEIRRVRREVADLVVGAMR